ATGPGLATLMAGKGVVETGASSLRALAEQPKAIAAMQASSLELLDLLKTSRDEEGVKLHDMLFGHLSEIDALSRSSVVFAVEQAVSIQQIYKARIAELDQDRAVSDERIAGEVAVLASKADVSEELDRLCAHVETGRALLASDDAVGRNLGFLAQELNREANTLCSKSATLDLTNAGLALKSVIDQFKEQAANVE
ncbi:MAG: DUF1732 domain-containing protein, partial [Henriciella sp.]|nr:DUF1732 domain-containing protein [Henriciella sp.]